MCYNISVVKIKKKELKLPMEIKNLRNLICKVKEDESTYNKLISCFDYLMRERIKLTGNDLRSVLKRPAKEVDTERVLKSVKEINLIAYQQGVDFNIKEDWATVEAFLRLSILDDIKSEFEKQEKN